MASYATGTWRRPPGRPRNNWLDQLRNDSTRPTGDLWKRAVGRGHGDATNDATALAGCAIVMMMMMIKWHCLHKS